MKNQYLLLLFLLSCTPPLPEENESQLSECNAPYGYDCGDIAVLKSFIEINSQKGDSQIFRHYMDYNDNGVIEPLEFGLHQAWDDGRLIWLELNYPKDIIMKKDNPSELDLTNYRLTVMPDNIGDLDALENLFLHDNEFTSIPASIGNLTKLKMLDLENNFITDLPETIGNLNNLVNLVLDFNQLTNLPETIGSLSSLITLEVRNNNLSSLPESIGNLSQIEWLYLNDNLLETLPESIGNLETLMRLDVTNNMLSSFPDNICTIYPGEWGSSEYECCGGGECGTGETYSKSVCEEICTAEQYGEHTECRPIEIVCISPPKCLKTFSIGNNKFCDDDEDGLIDLMPTCIDLEYENQNCSQCQPWEFNIEGYCADSSDYNILQYFLDLNPMSMEEGLIPMHAYGVKNADWWVEGRLIEISLQHNQLTSEIPENIGNLDKLQILELTGNYLKGEIPENIINLGELKILKLNSNQLSGSIPENIGLLLNLEKLYLKDNQLGCYKYDYECDPNGEDPNCCITHCDATDECNGGIPQSITNLINLKKLHLEENILTGSIPVNIGNLSSLSVLRLNINQLSETIPESIVNLNNITKIYLSNNNLSGQIPLALCTMGLSHLHYFGNDLCPPYPSLDCADEVEGDSQYCSP